MVGAHRVYDATGREPKRHLGEHFHPQSDLGNLLTIGGGRVYRSDDAGSHWTDCSAGLPVFR